MSEKEKDYSDIMGLIYRLYGYFESVYENNKDEKTMLNIIHKLEILINKYFK